MFPKTLLKIFYHEPLKKRKLKKFYQQFINPGDLCFDIGSNIGERMEIFLRLGAKVISIEPQIKCIQFQQQKFKGQNNVQWLQIGISNHPGFQDLMICNVNECSSFSNEFITAYHNDSDLTWDEKFSVQVNTLDEIIKIYGVPQYCKVDVEGYEANVFESLATPIPFIEFEFNRPLVHIAVRSIERLAQIGNSEFNYIEFEDMELKQTEWINYKDMINILNHLPERILTGEILARIPL